MRDSGPRTKASRTFWRRLRPRKHGRRLKFTREGRYFVAISIGIGLAAINTGNNLLYLLLGWLLSMIIASGVLSDLTLRRLTISRRPPPRIFASTPFLTEISVTNDKTRLASFSIEIEDLIDGRPLDKKCYFLKVPAGKKQRTSYRHTFHRRGKFEFSGFRVATRFPFALFTKRRDLEKPAQVLVYPKVHPMPPPTPQARRLGDTVAQKVGRRGEFFGLREYRAGDDRRSIHWRSSARTGKLMVREFEEEAQRRVTLVVDNALPLKTDDRAEQKLEDAISLAASLAVSYLQHGFGVRLIARGKRVDFGAGPHHIERILQTLALLPTTSPDQPFLGTTDNRGDNVLVAPSLAGFVPSDRPAVTSVGMQ